MPDPEHTLEVALTAIYRSARVRHGFLGLTCDDFSRLLLQALRKSASTDGDAIRLISHFHTEDFYLTAACSLGDDRAWSRFGAAYGRFIRQLVYRSTRANEPAREVADSLIADLYLPDRSGRSRIGSFDGRCSLAQWLRVIVANRITNERARKVHRMELRDADSVCDSCPLSRFETAQLPRFYADAVRGAFIQACRELTCRERLLLLWRFEDSLRLGEIASLLGVHISTVTRQMDRVCVKIRRQVFDGLVTKYKLTRLLAEECIAEADHTLDAISPLAVLRSLNEERRPHVSR